MTKPRTAQHLRSNSLKPTIEGFQPDIDRLIACGVLDHAAKAEKVVLHDGNAQL
jgi:hypothetical protein